MEFFVIVWVVGAVIAALIVVSGKKRSK